MGRELLVTTNIFKSTSSTTMITKNTVCGAYELTTGYTAKNGIVRNTRRTKQRKRWLTESETRQNAQSQKTDTYRTAKNESMLLYMAC